MTKIKTSELTGAALDWAVAKAKGLGYRNDEKYGPMCFRPSTVKGLIVWDSRPLPYSTDWAHGGPIIEREGVELKRGLTVPFVWAAFAFRSPRAHRCGPTPLIAAMRCFVSSKLGDEVEIPKELLT